MKGFFKRDLYLMAATLRFQVPVLALMLALTVAVPTYGNTMLNILNLYIFVFPVSALISLCQTDEQIGWTAYAFALPGGRIKPVAARYVVTLAFCLGGGLLAGVVDVLVAGWDYLTMCLGILGSWLFFAALALPLTYRFGNQSRMIILLALGVSAGVTGGLGVVDGMRGLRMLSWAILPLGLAALAVSYRVSLGIMERKEL